MELEQERELELELERELELMRYLLPLLLTSCAVFEEPQFPQYHTACKPDADFWHRNAEPLTGTMGWVVVPYKELQETCKPAFGFTSNACIFKFPPNSVVFSWLTVEQAKQRVTAQCESLYAHEFKHHNGWGHK